MTAPLNPSDSTAPRWVLMLAIGPVQGFIAAARRTRDLWYGSTLLSAVATTAARRLKSSYGAELVFPAGLRSPETGELSQVVAASNKVVAVLHCADMAAVAATLRNVVVDELKSHGDKCRSVFEHEELDDAIDWPRFNLQLTQAMECYTAWAPWPVDDSSSDDAGYLQAYRRANALLDARKRLRDFAPNACATSGARLSSLDAERETVLLAEPEVHAKILKRARRVMGIDNTEELDALGLIKRVLGREQAFPAVARVALAPWIDRWNDAQRQAVAEALDALKPLGLVSLNKCRPPHPMAVFPYDAELLLNARRKVWAGRAEDLAEAFGYSPADVVGKFNDLNAVLSAPPKGALPEGALPSEESVYVAMLVADGDHMGKLLNPEDFGASDPASPSALAFHRDVSARLASFAADAAKITHVMGGVCIYAGGDDVMAVLPVSAALGCARALAESFATTLSGLGPLAGQRSTSLSLGLVFAHVLTPFALLRQWAERAQQLAKDGHDGHGLRNALGVIVQPASGTAVQALGRWSDINTAPVAAGLDGRLAHWQSRFAAADTSQRLSGVVPYDLQQLVRKLPPHLLAPELERLLPRRNATAVDIALAEQFLSRDRSANDHTAHQRLSAEWYIGRWLAAQPQPVATAIKVEQ